MEECALTLNVSILCRRVVLYGWCDGVWVVSIEKPSFQLRAEGQRSMVSVQIDDRAVSRPHSCFSVDRSQRSIVLPDMIPTATAVHPPSARYIMIVTIISPMDAAYLEAVSLDTS